jgi:Peptidase U49
MKGNRITFLGLALLLMLRATAAQSKDFSGMYDMSTLEYWGTRYRQSTYKIRDQLILPYLTAREREGLSGVRFDFPQKGMHGELFDFYTPGDHSSVVMPVFSLKFLDDLCTAYAWLQINGYSLETVSDYTAMLEYASFPGGRFPAPLRALHIPENALSDPQVAELSLDHFVTARAFIMLHELGHIYHQDPPTVSVSPQQSRANEEQADRFAAEVMSRTPVPPLGILIFFMADAHLAGYPPDPNATHPLSGHRLHSLATHLENPALGRGIDQLGDFLDDPDVQLGIIAVAKGTDEFTLAPRRPGQLPKIVPSNGGQSAAAHLPFQGSYVGTYIQRLDPQETIPLEVVLERHANNQVVGHYSFGLGVGSIEGTVQGDQLYFDWRWGGDYGRGTLRASNGGADFSGTWGYHESADNGGTLRGHRQN